MSSVFYFCALLVNKGVFTNSVVSSVYMSPVAGHYLWLHYRMELDLSQTVIFLCWQRIITNGF
jgi:hypothetical protein